MNGQSKIEVSAPKQNVGFFMQQNYFLILYKFTADLAYHQSPKGAIKLTKKAPKGCVPHPFLGTCLLLFDQNTSTAMWQGISGYIIPLQYTERTHSLLDYIGVFPFLPKNYLKKNCSIFYIFVEKTNKMCVRNNCFTWMGKTLTVFAGRNLAQCKGVISAVSPRIEQNKDQNLQYLAQTCN